MHRWGLLAIRSGCKIELTRHFRKLSGMRSMIDGDVPLPCLLELAVTLVKVHGEL